MGLVPLFLWLLDQAHYPPDCSLKRRIYKVSAVGFAFGVGFQGVYYAWFMGLHPLTWLGFSPWESLAAAALIWCVAILPGALLLMLFSLFSFGIAVLFPFRTLSYPLKKALQTGLVFILPAIWVLLFDILAATSWSIPWARLEYTQASLPAIRAAAVFVGGDGITFLIVLYNLVLALMVYFLRPSLRNVSLFLCTMLCIPLTLPWLKIKDKPLVLPASIAVIQGNLPIETVRSESALTPDILNPSYYNPLQKLPPDTLTALPEEGVVPGYVELSHPLRNIYLRKLRDIAITHRLFIIVGVTSYDSDHNSWYNSMAFIPPDKGPVRFYHKRTLVPFGEQTPPLLFCSDAHWFEDLLKIFHIEYENVFQPGIQDTLFPIQIPGNGPHRSLILTGPLICFEGIYGRLYQGYAAHKANLIIDVGNLGWFHNHAMLEKQFLAIMQMQAAEWRLPVILSANTGPSAIISASGDITAQIPTSHRGRLIFFNPPSHTENKTK